MKVMKFVDVEIDDQDPWLNDVTGRRAFGEALERLIRQAPADGLVLGVKSPWGTGKSVFLRRLASMLRVPRNRLPVVQLNLWEHDHVSDPLVAFSLALCDLLKRSETAGSQISDRIVGAVSALLPVSKILVRDAAIDLANYASGGVTDKVLDAYQEYRSSRPDVWLEEAREHAGAIGRFRDCLEQAVESLSGNRDATVPRRLVFLVDELDRCRPDFAIRALERIKHLFNARGVVFVMAIDDDNLQSAVKALYGEGLNAEKYLRRFFDYEVNLPVPKTGLLVFDLFSKLQLHRFKGDEAVIKTAYSSLGDTMWRDSLNEVAAEAERLVLMTEFCRVLGMTFRDTSQAATAFAIAYGSRSTKREFCNFIACLMVTLRFSHPLQYKAILSGEARLEGLFKDGLGSDWKDRVVSSPVISGAVRLLSAHSKPYWKCREMVDSFETSIKGRAPMTAYSDAERYFTYLCERHFLEQSPNDVAIAQAMLLSPV